MSSAVQSFASALRDESLSPSPASDVGQARRLHAVNAHPSTPPSKILLVAGTRPECIKLAPLAHALARHPDLRVGLVNSGQHATAVRACLAEMGLQADVELAPLPALPHLAASHRHLRRALAQVIRGESPDLVFVQGDTLTAYTAARAAHDAGCDVAHIEAGLRTDAVLEPFPEEWFRRRIARYACLHFAPSQSAFENLLAEGIDARSVHRVGNTGIDSLRRCLQAQSPAQLRGRRVRSTVLVTLHRRANYDRNSAIICDALADLAAARPELRFLFPVHPNPRVSAAIRRRLEAHPAFDLVEPMRYSHFIECAARAALIISDSGGIQEEAPHLGTPLLVPRINTERPECLATGFVRLVAVNRESIVRSALDALDAQRPAPLPFDERAPFGAGDAAQRIVAVLEMLLRSHANA
ncbi:MAG: UDP-N-acetylglucosamine 2-epimerase (non-hydrolyzing) [Betaproteobacteria bacterium]